jgi:protein-S-isoprenylcysteine O-methyltransferase Ste14
LGIPSLPFRSLALTIGVLLVPFSIFYIFTSCLGIFALGQGAPGIELTKTMVDELVYKTSRNPMSLGFYAGCLALGFLAGSTYFTLWTLIEIMPFHILYIKIFEELELEMRFGQSYIEYKKHTPFLIPDIRKIVSKKSLGRNA